LIPARIASTNARSTKNVTTIERPPGAETVTSAASSSPPKGRRLTDDEFMQALRNRFIAVAGEGADAAADNSTVAEWREGFENEPEDAADAEMEYWTNDGDE
jgi:hypothetical protein